MPFYVYLLRCRDGSYYAGHTDALERRLAQHRAGLGSDWTRRRLPVELMWTDTAPTRDEALAFERRIKGWTRAKKEALIAGDWESITELARPPHASIEKDSTSVRPELVEGRPELVEGRPELVEGRSDTVVQRPSTSLRTNGVPASGNKL